LEDLNNKDFKHPEAKTMLSRNLSTLPKVLTSAALLALSVTMAGPQQAQAGTLDLSSGWNYSTGLKSNGSGGNAYALTGLAIKQDAQNVYIAINGGTDPTTGTYNSGSANNNINYGDLFFNFTGNNFATANAASSLFGVHFAAAPGTAGAILQMGLYSNVQAKSVTSTHSGYSSLQHYFNNGYGSVQTQGTDLNTKEETKAYYGNNGTGPIYNVIDTGTKVANISPLTAAVLGTNLGLDFGKYNANSAYTFGFQVSKSALPTGDFMANLFYECGNSGIAVEGNIAPVPEPATMLGLALGGIGLVTGKMKQRRQVG
jgi:PEP-CTERM motif